MHGFDILCAVVCAFGWQRVSVRHNPTTNVSSAHNILSNTSKGWFCNTLYPQAGGDASAACRKLVVKSKDTHIIVVVFEVVCTHLGLDDRLSPTSKA
jgi:hypothetical protein